MADETVKKPRRSRATAGAKADVTATDSTPEAVAATAAPKRAGARRKALPAVAEPKDEPVRVVSTASSQEIEVPAPTPEEPTPAPAPAAEAAPAPAPAAEVAPAPAPVVEVTPTPAPVAEAAKPDETKAPEPIVPGESQTVTSSSSSEEPTRNPMGNDLALFIAFIALIAGVVALVAPMLGVNVGKGGAATAAVPPGLVTDVQALKTDVEALKRRPAPAAASSSATVATPAAPAPAAAASARGPNDGTVMMVALHLRGVVRGATPFATELAALKGAAGSEAAYAKSLETLALYADRGVASFDDLITSYEILVPRALAESAVAPLLSTLLGPDAGQWQGTARAAMEPLAPVLRAFGGLDPDSVTARLTRAEAFLRERNLPAAVEVLALVDGEPGRILADWLKVARARLAVERASSDLASTAMVRLGK